MVHGPINIRKCFVREASTIHKRNNKSLFSTLISNVLAFCEFYVCLLHVPENWTAVLAFHSRKLYFAYLDVNISKRHILTRDSRRIIAAEMKCMRRTAGYTWTDYKTNEQIAKDLKTTPILDKLLEYKRSWIQHVLGNRLPRVMKYYSPTGRRNYGRPLKRLLDT